MCGDSKVVEKWMNGQYAMGQKYKDKIGHIQKTLHSWWKRNVAYSVGLVDDYVKHISEGTIRRPTTWRTLARKGRERSQSGKETIQKTGRAV